MRFGSDGATSLVLSSFLHYSRSDVMYHFMWYVCTQRYIMYTTCEVLPVVKVTSHFSQYVGYTRGNVPSDHQEKPQSEIELVYMKETSHSQRSGPQSRNDFQAAHWSSGQTRYHSMACARPNYKHNVCMPGYHALQKSRTLHHFMRYQLQWLRCSCTTLQHDSNAHQSSSCC